MPTDNGPLGNCYAQALGRPGYTCGQTRPCPVHDETGSPSNLDDLDAYEAGPARWYWRLGEMEGTANEVSRHFLAHRFVDTEPACGEASGLERWSRAPASAPKCDGCGAHG